MYKIFIWVLLVVVAGCIAFFTPLNNVLAGRRDWQRTYVKEKKNVRDVKRTMLHGLTNRSRCWDLNNDGWITPDERIKVLSKAKKCQ